MKLITKKNNIDNFEKIELDNISYENIEQDISRSWRFLETTHTLKEDEVCVIRIKLFDKKNNRKTTNNKEHIIHGFTPEEYENYSNFIKKYATHRDGIYHIWYQCFKIEYNDDVKNIEYNNMVLHQNKFVGKKEYVSSTNLLIADVDEYEYETYLKYKELFKSKGIDTLDVFSGHGYHFLIKIEDCKDKDIYRKWSQLLEEYGIAYDPHCVNEGRVLRLPFLINPKGDVKGKADIIDGEYGVPTYTVEEIFNKFGYNYNTYSLSAAPKKIPCKKTKVVKEVEQQEVGTIDLSIYNIKNIDTYSDGIKNMLKGLVKGHRYYQVWCLTLFFKRRGYTLEQVQDIMSILESNSDNSGNSWNMETQVEEFYKFNGISKDDLSVLEDEFGEILLPTNSIEDTYKIPLGVAKPLELQIYIYLLKNGNKRKKDIVNDLGIGSNTLDRCISKSKIIKRDGMLYVPVEVFTQQYKFLNEEELNKVSLLNKNELAIYLYLSFRMGDNKEIKTSIKSICKATKLSHTTVTNTIIDMEKKECLNVKREKNYSKFNEKNRESNTYRLF